MTAVRVVMVAGTAAVIAGGVLLVSRADSHANRMALADRPKRVTVVEARAAQYRPSRRYVGTILPWVEARIAITA